MLLFPELIANVIWLAHFIFLKTTITSWSKLFERKSLKRNLRNFIENTNFRKYKNDSWLAQGKSKTTSIVKMQFFTTFCKNVIWLCTFLPLQPYDHTYEITHRECLHWIYKYIFLVTFPIIPTILDCSVAYLISIYKYLKKIQSCNNQFPISMLCQLIA